MKTLTEISLDDIHLPKNELRTLATQEGITELAQSIKKIGVLQPILVEKKGKEYWIVAGGRRFIAAQQAGLSSIPCVVRKFKEDEKYLATLEENLRREDVSHMDIARYLFYMTTERGYSQPELAKRLGYTQPYISAHLRLLRIPEELQAAIEARQIDYQSGLHLSRLEDPKKRKYYLEYAIKDGAGAGRILQWVQTELGTKKVLPSQSNLSDKIPTKDRPTQTLFQCFLCGENRPNNDMILVRLDSECFQTLKKMIKMEKEIK